MEWRSIRHRRRGIPFQVADRTYLDNEVRAYEVQRIMGVKVTIEHNGQGWIDVFKSAGMQAAVDDAGKRIAAEAGSHFDYEPGAVYDQMHNNRFTVGGVVAAVGIEGDEEEAMEKVLTKAVHR